MNTNKTINFHRVTESRWFENVICHLKSEYSFTAGPHTDMGFHDINHSKTCHITFDDGEISFYNVVLPVLRKYKIPASLFVSPRVCREKINYWFQEIEAFDSHDMKKVIASVTGISVGSIMEKRIESILKSVQIDLIKEIIRESRRRLPYSSMPFRNIGLSELRDIDRSGLVTLGAHTLNHPILRNESDSNSRTEIANSVDELSEILNHPVHCFAYPNGIPSLDFTAREKKFLSECNIRTAYKNEACSSPGDDHLSLPRIAISDNENLAVIKIKMYLGGTWDSLKKLDPRGEYSERKKLLELME